MRKENIVQETKEGMELFGKKIFIENVYYVIELFVHVSFIQNKTE